MPPLHKTASGSLANGMGLSAGIVRSRPPAKRSPSACRQTKAMSKMSRMTLLEAFPEIVRGKEPSAPYTLLRLGGPTEFLAQPRSGAELAALLTYAAREKMPVRVLGVGSNILVRDEGVSGLV